MTVLQHTHVFDEPAECTEKCPKCKNKKVGASHYSYDTEKKRTTMDGVCSECHGTIKLSDYTDVEEKNNEKD